MNMRRHPTFYSGKLIILSMLLAIGWIALTDQMKSEAPTTSVASLRVAYSTYLGGSALDSARDVAVDSQYNVYITGGTASSDFPTTPGAYDQTFNGRHDVYVMKLDPDGSLVWSTFIGGPNYDRAYAIEVDSQGYVYVGGRAGDGYPTTAGVLQPAFGGDNTVSHAYGPQDGFVTKLSPDGSSVIWSTFFGGGDGSFIRDIDVDGVGQVHLGETAVSIPNPHITPGAFQTNLTGANDGVVAKLSADGTQALWATYLGGSSQTDVESPSIRVDPLGNVYVLGGTASTDIPTTPGAYDRTLGGTRDLHLAKFSPDGAFVFGTFLGGSDNEFTETHGLALDSQNNAIVAATTLSSDFPTTPGAFQTTYGGPGGPGTGANTNYNGDAFVAKISSNGSALLAGTFVGGRFGDGLEGVDVDAQDNVYASGGTYSDDFPVTADAFQTTRNGPVDFFAVKLSGDLGQLSYSSYLGGSKDDTGRAAAADPGGGFYVAGTLNSTDWPTVNPLQAAFGGGSSDGAVAKFTFSGVSIQGPTLGEPDIAYSFTATIETPISPTQPFTYVWQATGQTPLTRTDGISSTVSFAWTTDGIKTITVTASDSSGGSVTDNHTIEIGPLGKLYLPLIIRL
jgi:hypothetical protein